MIYYTRGGGTGSKGHQLIEHTVAKFTLVKKVLGYACFNIWTQHDQFSGGTPLKCCAWRIGVLISKQMIDDPFDPVYLV